MIDKIDSFFRFLGKLKMSAQTQISSWVVAVMVISQLILSLVQSSTSDIAGVS